VGAVVAKLARLDSQDSNAVHCGYTEVTEVMREGHVTDICGPERGNYPVCGQCCRRLPPSLRDEWHYPRQLVTHHISLARSLASSLVPIWKLSIDDCFLPDVLLLLLLGLLPLVGVISLTLPCSESSDLVEDTQDKFAIGKLPE